MVGCTFLKKRQDVFDAAMEQFEEEAGQFEGLAELVTLANTVLAEKSEAENDDEPESQNQGSVRTDDKPERIIEYWHVASRIHLGRYLLNRDELKEILLKECLHYARVCRIAIVHYCIMDNHFHLVVGLTKTSHRLTKMIGCIKQQFTNKFKTWFNEVYRPENRYRRDPLKNGTLWEGPSKPELIETDAQLGACTLYVENNRLVVLCKDEIGALEQTPCFIYTPESDEDGEVEFKLQDCYKELLERLKSFRFQSACHYLGAVGAEDTFLTDGHDAVWASDSEVESYFEVAAKDLPDGWRKVWFKECPGIVKPTPNEARAYGRNPFYESLGRTENLRAAHFGRLLLGSCFKKRQQIAKIETKAPSYDAGLSLN